MTRDTFCSFCGTRYVISVAHGVSVGYPRTCAGCGVTIWANPIPVCVVLAPILLEGRAGLLTIRRGIQPGLGKLALVGGFLEEHESWQAGAAREVREETGVTIEEPRPFWYASSSPKPNRVLLFSVAPPIQAASVAPFAPNKETLERGVIFGPEGLDEELAFSLHAEAARRYFREQGVTGPLDFRRI